MATTTENMTMKLERHVPLRELVLHGMYCAAAVSCVAIAAWAWAAVQLAEIKERAEARQSK